MYYAKRDTTATWNLVSGYNNTLLEVFSAGPTQDIDAATRFGDKLDGGGMLYLLKNNKAWEFSLTMYTTHFQADFVREFDIMTLGDNNPFKPHSGNDSPPPDGITALHMSSGGQHTIAFVGDIMYMQDHTDGNWANEGRVFCPQSG